MGVAMNTDLIFNHLADATVHRQLTSALGAKAQTIVHHIFPDGESYFRCETPITGASVAILANLSHPDNHTLSLLLFAQTLRDLGAGSIGLIAPYLPYMRQDTRFQAGEGITSRYFANIIGQHFDWLVTIDPHLHRYHALGEIYTIPTVAAHATGLIADYISQHIEHPVLIGPDSESEQWVATVATLARAPYTVLEKTRHGDNNVEVSVPHIDRWARHTPVLVDDIISSGHTMLETLAHLKRLSFAPAVCIGVHGLFSNNVFPILQIAADKVITTNTIPHPSNQIDITPVLAQAIRELHNGH